MYVAQSFIAWCCFNWHIVWHSLI